MLTLAALLHAQTADVWELLALVGPFTIVLGAGVVLVIVPIVRAQGERYEHRELRPDETEASRNGNGATKGVEAEEARPGVDETAAATRSKN
jgi:hypothetical protein